MFFFLLFSKSLRYSVVCIMFQLISTTCTTNVDIVVLTLIDIIYSIYAIFTKKINRCIDDVYLCQGCWYGTLPSKHRLFVVRDKIMYDCKEHWVRSNITQSKLLKSMDQKSKNYFKSKWITLKLIKFNMKSINFNIVVIYTLCRMYMATLKLHVMLV